MLTADIKINGKPIGHIEARRLPWSTEDGASHYTTICRVEQPGGEVRVRRRTVCHRPADGALELIRKAIAGEA